MYRVQYISVQCTVYSVLYTVYSGTLYTIHCTLVNRYTAHCTLYTVHCTLVNRHIVQCTLYTVRYTLYSVHYTLYTVPPVTVTYVSSSFALQLQHYSLRSVRITIQSAVLYLLFITQPFQVFRTQTVGFNDEKCAKICN